MRFPPEARWPRRRRPARRCGPAGAIALALSLALPAAEPLWTFRPGPEGRAAIRVNAARTGPPISRRLFGKFTEHLHRNIYHGMWAQVVRNPGFEDWKYFFSDDAALKHERRRAAESGSRWPEGLAAHWLPEGEGGVTCSLAPEAVNSEASQHIAVSSLEGPAAGIRQEHVYLPLHRESDYLASVYLRSRGMAAVTLSVRWEGKTLASAEIHDLTTEWRRHRVRLRIAEAVPRGSPLTVALTTSEPGELWVDQLFIFPGDHVHGFDRDVVDLCRSARLSILRYPGGNFASGYHFEDGIGPVDRRPMRRNPAWDCPEYNHVGTGEFLAFCEAVGCEPMICVNAGDGRPEEAARWVEYCNGSLESPLGALRGRDGHPRPYNVRYWEVGNELYGSWQVGHCTAEEYARRYREIATRMLQADPDILLIANGHDASWHAPLLEHAPELVRSFSLHPLVGGGIPRDADPRSAYLALMAYPVWYHGFLEGLAEHMRRHGLRPQLSITELQIFTNKPELPTNATLAEAIYMVRFFHMAVRLGGLVDMITHSALVNHGGGLRKERGVVYAQPSWWATHLYSTLEGTVPAAVEVEAPVYGIAERSMPAVTEAPWVDAIALAGAEGSLLAVVAVNVHPDEAIPLSLRLEGWPLPARLRGRVLSGPSFLARNSWEEPDRVVLREIDAPAAREDGALLWRLPPCSVTELVFRR